MKRISTTLIFAFIFMASYAYDVVIDKIYYNLNSQNNEAEVTYRDLNSASYLSNVTIPDFVENNGITYKITSIGNYAFQSCNSIESVVIPNTVTNIGDCAFLGCSKLKSVAIPCSLCFIGEHAFKNCKALSSITIPDSVMSIGDFAFSDCDALISITISSSMTSIGQGVFENCNELSSVIIPNSVTSIGKYAFNQCHKLVTIKIPNSVKTIDENAFWLCNNLSSITIGNSVESIGNTAFAYCSSLTSVTCFAEIVPSTYANAFSASNVSNATLIVPEASLEAYKSTAPWSKFGTINSVESIPICATPTITFEDGELVYTTETDGADIVSEVKSSDIKKSYDLRVPLTATYEITAYATKAGYDNSEVATATLHWMDGTMDIATGTQEFGAKRAVLVSSNDGFVTISGLNDGEKVEVYSTDGKLIDTIYAAGNAANIAAKSGETIILKINGETIKVLVK